ncbi:C4b-binding protein-like [Leucoraja erinacea]|uniref:C4b-binding protein-like n=1 Tax=Leucoraja erinaceus TaxID=7782 RepID=UPI002453B138|nr:C4b-binding protein-like [Leucoraja erinacea]
MSWLEWRAVVVVILTAATRAAGECGKLPHLENGSPRDDFLNQVAFPVGTKVTYTCIPGFMLKQGTSPTITCEASSSWSPLETTCERKSCGSPGEILNGRYNATGNEFGDKATFSCDTGYNLVGRETRLCEDSGWSGQVPTCEVVKCSDAPAISNGSVSGRGDSEFWEHGMTATYSCKLGYTLIGQAEVTCKADGQWSSSPPSCRVPGCGKPPLLENGSPRDEDISQDSFPVGSTVTYRCIPGFKLKDGTSPKITCNSNLTWSPLQTTCERKSCGSPGEILNGRYNATGNEFGDKVTFSCDTGYNLVGRDTRLCEDSGWSGQVPTCEVVKCSDAPAISNGSVSGRGDSEFWEHGMTATYSCKPGYTLIGQAEVTCKADGQWSSSPPSCRAPGCGKPPHLENGSPRDEHISQDSFPVGSTVTYRCIPGFKLEDGTSPKITCNSNLTWSPLQTTCERKSCGSPGEILNGRYNATGNKFGDQVTFFCDTGYNLVGRDTRLCEDGGWSGQVPTCEVVKCSDAPAISDGSVSGRGDSEFWEYGMTATYSCKPGYTLIGQAEVTCKADGQWSSSPPSCRAENSRTTRHTTRAPNSSSTVTPKSDKGGSAGTSVGLQHILSLLLTATLIFCLQL